MHRSRLAGFIIDCRTDDLDAATQFWSSALGMSAVEREDGIYDRLDAAARDLAIEVQRVQHDSRLHLDIETDDIEAEAARLEALGAKKVAFVKRWWVMEAPTGQRSVSCGRSRISRLYQVSTSGRDGVLALLYFNLHTHAHTYYGEMRGQLYPGK